MLLSYINCFFQVQKVYFYFLFPKRFGRSECGILLYFLVTFNTNIRFFSHLIYVRF